MKTRRYPQIGYLDGSRYQSAILSGCAEIIKHEKELNRLNVFPIPDRDTGSNLKKTLIPLFEKFPVPEARIGIVGQNIADSAVRSALGYSGIIFSQILMGLAEALHNQQRIYPGNLGSIISNAVKKAYQSVEKPVEGTILSVLREWTEEVSRICPETGDFTHILETSYKKALAALKDTPDQLEILRKNRVVDAGGKAFVYFLAGILDFVKNGRLERISSKKVRSKEYALQDSAAFPYCVECCVRAQGLNRKEIIKRLGEMGQDLIFYGAAHFAKLHINTQNPEAVFSLVSSYGELSSKKILPCSPDPSSREKKSFCLVTDSTCDMKVDLIENNNVYFVPIKVQAGDNIYTDRWNLIPEEFYKIFSASSSLPKTSQPSLMDFNRIYRHLLIHYQFIISVHLSKALSGTFQTAVQASQSVSPERISVIDGKNISVGLGLVLLEGIGALVQGKSREEVILRLKTAADNTHIFIGLPTLKYLVRGGRITKTKGFLAKILNINPILSISEKGALIPVSKARGEKNLQQKILDKAYEQAKIASEEFSIAVAHTNAPDIADRVAQNIKKDLRQEAAFVMSASPALGAHAGPGAFGIAVHIAEAHSSLGTDDTLNI